MTEETPKPGQMHLTEDGRVKFGDGTPEGFMEYIRNSSGFGVMAIANYFLPPMSHLAQIVNPRSPFLQTDTEMGKLKEIMQELAKRPIIRIDKEFTCEYVSQHQRLRRMVEEIPKVEIQIGYALTNDRTYCFTCPGALVSVRDDIRRLPENPPSELTELISGMYTYGRENFWMLTATKIPEILLYDLISRTELVIGISDLMTRLFHDHQPDLKQRTYIIDRKMTPLAVCYFEDDWRMLTMSHNGQAIVHKVGDDEALAYVRNQSDL